MHVYIQGQSHWAAQWIAEAFPGNCCCESALAAITSNPVLLLCFSITRKGGVPQSMKIRDADTCITI